jgi:GDP-4-dehydro-6-deoxy-D-mannose reductase
LSKLAQDQLALRAAADDGLDVTVARPFNHGGPRQGAAYVVSGFARQIARIELGLAPPEIRVGNLDARRDMTDVRDIVDAYVRLMDAGTKGRAYNICSGRAWRIGDLLAELLQCATQAIDVVVEPARLRPNDVPVVQGDATRLRADLGWQPRIPVEQMLVDTLDWWRTETREGR